MGRVFAAERSWDQCRSCAVAEGLNRAEVVEAVRERSAKSSRSSKGRGATPKPRKTAATIRTAGGVKITFEHRRRVDDEVIHTALAGAMAQLDSRAEGRAAA